MFKHNLINEALITYAAVPLSKICLNNILNNSQKLSGHPEQTQNLFVKSDEVDF